MNKVTQYQGKSDFFEYLFNKDSKAENKPVSRFMILPSGLKKLAYNIRQWIDLLPSL